MSKSQRLIARHKSKSSTNSIDIKIGDQPPSDDHDPNSKSKDAPIKVILSLFGLLVVVFIMFSVFQPKQARPPRPPLKVFYDKKKFRHDHDHNPKESLKLHIPDLQSDPFLRPKGPSEGQLLDDHNVLDDDTQIEIDDDLQNEDQDDEEQMELEKCVYPSLHSVFHVILEFVDFDD